MSFHVFFSFSVGLAAPLMVPKGTKAAILAHVREVERVLGLTVEKPLHADDPPHWNHWSKTWREGFPEVDDKTLCSTVEGHNAWVQSLYDQIAGWSDSPVADGEELTPADAREFWQGLTILKVDPPRWTREFYRARMEELYEAMRGRPTAGMTFDAKPLSQRQAASVFNLFEQYLDRHGLDLEVPKGEDYLASSYDGGYEWCEKCGAVTPEYGDACSKRKCPLPGKDGQR